MNQKAQMPAAFDGVRTSRKRHKGVDILGIFYPKHEKDVNE